MKIEIIDISTPNVAKLVWHVSRPSLKYQDIDIEQIKKLDLPVNEFPTLVLEITSTILEREIITTDRNHTMWAQTSRVQNILEFEYPTEFSTNKDFFESQRDLMIEASSTMRQDEYRSLLPIMSLTTYCIRISARDLIGLMKYFENFADKNSHLRKRFLNVANSISLALSSLDYHEAHFKSYKAKALLKRVLSEENTLAGSFAVVTSTVPMALRAHMVRHRALHIADNLEQLLSSELIVTETLSMQLKIQVSGHVTDFKSIVGKRSCWIAQYGLWKDFLNKASEIMNIGQSELPCSGGICPFKEDAMARLTDKDPNAPCPIHLRLEEIPASSEQIAEMRAQKEADKRPDFWDEEINNFNNGSL